MSTKPLSVAIRGVGLIGPGFDNWPAARAVLAGDTPWVPAATRVPSPGMLPPAERRRVGAFGQAASGRRVQVDHPRDREHGEERDELAAVSVEEVQHAEVYSATADGAENWRGPGGRVSAS